MLTSVSFWIIVAFAVVSISELAWVVALRGERRRLRKQLKKTCKHCDKLSGKLFKYKEQIEALNKAANDKLDQALKDLDSPAYEEWPEFN